MGRLKSALVCTGLPTTRGNSPRDLDYFLVSEVLAALVSEVTLLETDIVKSHQPVLMQLRAEPAEVLLLRQIKPKGVPTTMPWMRAPHQSVAQCAAGAGDARIRPGPPAAGLEGTPPAGHSWQPGAQEVSPRQRHGARAQAAASSHT